MSHDRNEGDACADLLAACESVVAAHDAAARLANFDRCGCESCLPLRAAIAKATALNTASSQPSGDQGRV